MYNMKGLKVIRYDLVIMKSYSKKMKEKKEPLQVRINIVCKKGKRK